MAFSDDDIDAIVATGQLSDPAAAAYLAQCLRQRRDKIGKAYFGKVLPLDRFRIEDARLVWDDLARKHDLGGVDDARVAWSAYDNAGGTKKPLPALPNVEPKSSR